MKMRTQFSGGVATQGRQRRSPDAAGGRLATHAATGRVDRAPRATKRRRTHSKHTLKHSRRVSIGPGSADGDILKGSSATRPAAARLRREMLFKARGPLSLFFSIFTPCRFLLRHAADVSLATRVTSGHAWICTLSLAAVSSQTHCMYVRQPPLIHARDARGRGRRRRRESSMRAATTSGCHRRHPIHAPLPLSYISRPR